jgi:hypothetical protein
MAINNSQLFLVGAGFARDWLLIAGMARSYKIDASSQGNPEKLAENPL